MNKVINFHNVNSGDWFEDVICFLKSNYRIIPIDTLHEFYSGSINLKDSCHITVDDGDKTFYDTIFPVLKKHNVPASIFVSPKICERKLNYWFQEMEGYNHSELKRIITDLLSLPINSLENFNVTSILKTMRINQIQKIIKIYQDITNTQPKAFQNMSVENLIEVDQSGLVSIGAHTLNHPILKNEDDINSKYEITGAIDRLANLLNHEIRYFSYPNGIPDVDFTEREQGYLRGAKVQLAFSTESKNFSAENNKMSIPRIGVSNIENMFFLRTKLLFGSPWDTLKKLKTTGEFRERRELSKIISNRNFDNISSHS